MRRRRRFVRLAAAAVWVLVGAQVVSGPGGAATSAANSTKTTKRRIPPTQRPSTRKATPTTATSLASAPLTGHIFGPPRSVSSPPAGTLSPPTVAPATSIAPPPSAVVNNTTWVQTFSDDFTGGLSPAWSVVTTGGGLLDDTFGSECYQAGQVAVTPDGVLTLTGAERAVTCNGRSRPYVSGMVTTRNKFAQAYGRFEARMKMPHVRGSWPAWWLMPSESFYGWWPRSGEIDIIEYVADAPSTVFHTIHWADGGGTKVQDASAWQVAGTANDWHVYAIEWEPGELRWYVDDALVKTFRPSSGGAPFDRAFYLILNQAVGGEWPGTPEPGFSNTVSVDWVRVWKRRS